MRDINQTSSLHYTCRLTIRSDGEAALWQPDKMGSYSLWGSSGGRKVWKHESRQNYLYYWQWGVNTGTEWMVGHSPFSSVRGIRQETIEIITQLEIELFYELVIILQIFLKE